MVEEYFPGALTVAEQKELKAHYFLRYEIDQFNTAISINGVQQTLNAKAANFQAMMKNRLAWAMQLKKMHWSDEAIAARILQYYTNKRSVRSSFDALQIEQSPSSRMKGETDNAIARRLLKLARIRSVFGLAYSHGLEPRVMPQVKNIPYPPQ